MRIDPEPSATPPPLLVGCLAVVAVGWIGMSAAVVAFDLMQLLLPGMMGLVAAMVGGHLGIWARPVEEAAPDEIEALHVVSFGLQLDWRVYAERAGRLAFLGRYVSRERAIEGVRHLGASHDVPLRYAQIQGQILPPVVGALGGLAWLGGLLVPLLLALHWGTWQLGLGLLAGVHLIGLVGSLVARAVAPRRAEADVYAAVGLAVPARRGPAALEHHLDGVVLVTRRGLDLGGSLAVVGALGAVVATGVAAVGGALVQAGVWLVLAVGFGGWSLWRVSRSLRIELDAHALTIDGQRQLWQDLDSLAVSPNEIRWWRKDGRSGALGPLNLPDDQARALQEVSQHLLTLRAGDGGEPEALRQLLDQIGARWSR